MFINFRFKERLACYSICFEEISLRKTVGKASPILVTLTSRSNSDFEHSNVNLKENKPDGVNPNSNDIDYYVQKMKEKSYGFRQTEMCLVFQKIRNRSKKSSFDPLVASISIFFGFFFVILLDLKGQ